MKLSDLNSNPHGVKSLRDLINFKIGFLFYPTPGSEHYKLLQLDRFHGYTHINDNHRKNSEKKLRE